MARTRRGRRAYDAARVVAAFGDTVRDEVELDQLTRRLVQVVNKTMLAAHVSLWPRPQPTIGPGSQRDSP